MHKIFAVTYALIIGIVAGIMTTVMIMGSVATPAHAGETCNTVDSTLKCSGQLHGLNGHDTSDLSTGETTLSGGAAQVGGGHQTFNQNTGEVTNCVGNICP